jgi:hypothetical protein
MQNSKDKKVINFEGKEKVLNKFKEHFDKLGIKFIPENLNKMITQQLREYELLGDIVEDINHQEILPILNVDNKEKRLNESDLMQHIDECINSNVPVKIIQKKTQAKTKVTAPAINKGEEKEAKKKKKKKTTNTTRTEQSQMGEENFSVHGEIPAPVRILKFPTMSKRYYIKEYNKKIKNPLVST